ncbi:MAG: hypothetical protein D6709_06560 [Chloroflexi bacterium]|uniref:Uncharacterized protein n=1 Tax=Candidatus Thermofonsia Clade 3 bacterium TaxID=2364212 RepID=A0A2M8QFX1_9CHLR|nr:MAG: hypothetical protein CUN48_02310 [Candidatus Thermofonsia Clade 3 bacterium]RMG64138.1 MAG: hypothetical protein D6709_06560 [Chloroflexota bacterium]
MAHRAQRKPALADDPLQRAEPAGKLVVGFTRCGLGVNPIAISPVGDGEQQVADLLGTMRVVAGTGRFLQLLAHLGQPIVVAIPLKAGFLRAMGQFLRLG